MDNLDDVLNGSEAVETLAPEAVVETPEPIAEANPNRPRDEHGRFAPMGEPEPAPAPEAAPPAAETEANVPIKALQEERRKRQELEQRLEAFTRQPQPQPAPQPRAQGPLEAPVPTVFEDEYAQSIFEMAVAHVRQELGPQIQNTAQTTNIEMHRALMRQAVPDFAETESAFFDLARENPVLMQELQRQPNPVQWAYDYTKKTQEVRQIGSLDLSAIKAAAVQEYLAQNQPPAAPQTIPSSLADTQSARSVAAHVGPPTLDSILGRR